MRRLSLAIAAVVLWTAAWIWIPAPTYALLAFGVGAPELSHWIIVGALVAMGLAARDLRRSRLALAAFSAAGLALFLALTVWVRVPRTIARFEAATRGMRAEPAHPVRSSPIVFADLFRGIPAGDSRITRDIPLATSPERLTADVYQPAAHGRYPIVVQIYGGAWQRGRPSDFAGFASRLASSGYVVIAIDYRHAPRYRWPAQIIDVNSALRWVAAHGAEYEGDSARVVLLGRSAGAHLATYAAWISMPIHVRGVVDFYGPTDLVDAYEHPPRPDPLDARSSERALLGGSLDAMPDRYIAASTITHLDPYGPPPPPTLLIYGRRDHVVEAKYGAVVTRALRDAGGQAAYLEIPWAEHGFDVVSMGPSSQLAFYFVERFIAWAVR